MATDTQSPPAAPGQPAEETAASPASPTPPTFASLDEEISHYTALANAERDAPSAPVEPAQAQDTPAPIRAPASSATTASQPEPDPSETPEPASADAETDTPEAEPDQAEDQPATDERLLLDGRPISRRDAPRLARELATVRTQHQETQAELETLRQQFTSLQATDQQVLSELAEQCGTDEQFEQARERAAQGDEQAREAYLRMREWRTIVTPVERRYRAQMAAVFEHLKTLPGMSAQDFAAIQAAENPVDALRRAYDVGRRAGEQHARTLLEPQVTTLRTKAVAQQPQPAAAGGQARPPATAASLVDARGVLTDEAEALIRSGALAGVALN